MNGRANDRDAVRAEAVAGHGRRSGYPPDRTEQQGSSWDILLIAVAGLILTSVARIHLLFPVLDTLQLTMVAGGAAMLFYLVNHHPARRISALGSPPTVLLVLFLGWMVFTLPWGLRQYTSFMFLTGDFLKTVVLFIVIVGCVRGLRDVERLALVYFAGAALYSVVVLAQFNLGESWRLGDLITYDSNDFALFAVSAVPLAVHFLADQGRGLRTKLPVGLGLGVMGVAFIQSGSRGGLLAMGAVVLFLLLRHRAVPLRWRVGGIGLLALLVAGVASGRYWDQMTTILNPSQDYNFTSETGRIQIWKRGMGYLWDNPITGVGPSNFQVAEGILSPMAFRQELGIGVPWTAPHNSFLQVAVELGVPGVLLFLALIWSVFSLLRKMERREVRMGGGGRREMAPRFGKQRAALAQALMGSLLGFLVGALFLSLAYSAILYTLFALAVALWKTTGTGSEAVPKERYWNPMNERAPNGGGASFVVR